MSLAMDECGGDDSGDDDGLAVIRRRRGRRDTVGVMRGRQNDKRDNVTDEDADAEQPRRAGQWTKASKCGGPDSVRCIFGSR